MIRDVGVWLTTTAHWHGPEGIPVHVREHLAYTLVAVLIGLAVALPAGLLIGHTGRGTATVGAVANSIRALPTFGLMVLLVIVLAPHMSGGSDAVYLVPVETVLVLLAVPPILAGTYAGVQNVAPAVRDAAAAMGMSGPGVLLRVELPNALPLIFSGVRSATLQCVATATVAAYVPLGGLGRYVVDGLSQGDYPQMASGAVLVAVLAVTLDALLAGLQRLVVSPGVSGHYPARSHRPAPATGAVRRRTST